MQHPCCSAFYFLIIQTLALRDSHLTREIEFFLIISMSLQCKYCDYATGIVIGYETRWSLFWHIQAPLWKESDFADLVRIYQNVLWDDCCKFPWYFLCFVFSILNFQFDHCGVCGYGGQQPGDVLLSFVFNASTAASSSQPLQTYRNISTRVEIRKVRKRNPAQALSRRKTKCK